MILTSLSNAASRASRMCFLLMLCLFGAAPVFAQGEADLVLPDLNSVMFFDSVPGGTLLLAGLLISALGLVFGLLVVRRSVSATDKLPFGVFLAVGIWLTWLYGPLGL